MSSFLSSAWHAFTNQVRLEGGINVETLGAAKVLDNRSSQFQVLDPGGASRDVTLPALGTSKGLVFVFRNTADAAENLVIKNAAAATIATLARGEAAVIGNESGAAWSILVEFPSVGSTGLNADTISEITAAAGVTIDGLQIKDGSTRPTVIADPGNAGAIPVTSTGTCSMTSAGAETRTLAIPTFVGQRLSLIDDVHVGNIVVTSAQAINQAGNTVMTFGAVADFIDLVAAQVGGALRWRVVGNDGVALS